MDLFAKVVNGSKPLTIFAKRTSVDMLQCCKYDPAKDLVNPNYFSHFGNIVAGSALYARITLLLVLYFVPKQITQNHSQNI